MKIFIGCFIGVLVLNVIYDAYMYFTKGKDDKLSTKELEDILDS